MSDIKIQHTHDLGLDKARELSAKWISEASSKMGLTCRTEAGAEQDTIHFERSGVKGQMRVSGQQFDLEVKLGMMMSAFKPAIEAEIRKNLGRLLG
jgi:putative polyhydroxyalkanoate system protein